jgi:acyl-coenzyme A synthetase/AMP-(fatty) acid ligase
MKSGVKTPALQRILTATAPLSAEDAIALEDHFRTEVLDVFGCSESGVFAMRMTARESDWRLTPPFRLESTRTSTLIHAAHLPAAVELPDLLEIVDERRFRWVGRRQDLINIAGKRGSLADLNRRLLRIEGVLDGILFQPQDESRLAAFVVAPGLTAAEIVQALRPQLDPVFMPRPIYMVDRLPRQETGKMARSDLLDLFRMKGVPR